MTTMLITGGGQGIGAATALLAAQQGYAVCVNYVHNSTQAELVAATIRKNGGQALAVQADISNEEAVQYLFDTAIRELGPLTVLINNAGITGKLGRFSEVETQSLRRVLEINVLGTMLCSREAIRRMSTISGGQGGTIINLSSRAAQVGSPHEYIHYAASKAAVETFTIGLSKEVANEGIRVNCVSPGIIETEIHTKAGDPDRPQRYASQIPMQRAGRPNEVAAAILWLASDEASYCNGSILAVSGGR